VTGTARRRYAGASAAERVAERRRRLLDAGLEVLGDEGWTAATVRAVCGRAGVAPRYFYEAFDDLDALAAAVFDESFDGLAATVVTAIAAAPDGLEPRVRAAVSTALRALTDDPRRARVLIVESHGAGPLADRRVARMRDVVALIAGYGREAFDAPPSAEPLLQVTATLLAGGLTETVASRLRGELPGDEDDLVDDLTALFVGTGRVAAARAARRR